MRTRKKLSHSVDPIVVKRQRGAFAGDVERAREMLKGSTLQSRGPPAGDADAYSVIEFCERHRISVQMFYKNRDEMPQTFRVGSRVLISREAATRWRLERETASAAEAAL